MEVGQSPSTHLSVLALLRLYRMRFTSERELQTCVSRALTENQIKFDPEVLLSPKDRIDFLTSSCVGIEIKIQDSTTSVIRQLHRYAQHERVGSLILVTSRAKHRSIPDKISGKPVDVVFLGANL